MRTQKQSAFGNIPDEYEIIFFRSTREGHNTYGQCKNNANNKLYLANEIEVFIVEFVSVIRRF